MLQHEIKRSKGLNKKSKRLGRGNASGKGNYSTKGLKGQLARSGGGMPAWFEGGQTPLSMRLPKLRGFKRYYKLIKTYQVVNLQKLQQDDNIKDGDEINKEILQKLNYIKKVDTPVKVLAKGGEGFGKKLVFVGIDKFSSNAKELIQKAGGEIK